MTDTNPDNLTDTTLPGAAQLTAAGGDAAVAETLSLAELNSYLGKDFKDKATALKAVKDTFSFVGAKAPQTQTAQPDPVLESKIQSLEEEVFYANNPQYREQRELIKQFGKSPAEVVEMPAFKNVFEKMKVADEVSQTKSVVASNSRLAETKNATETAVRVANTTGSAQSVAEVLAVEIREQSQA